MFGKPLLNKECSAVVPCAAREQIKLLLLMGAVPTLPFAERCHGPHACLQRKDMIANTNTHFIRGT